jgi:hypothetical protein
MGLQEQLLGIQGCTNSSWHECLVSHGIPPQDAGVIEIQMQNPMGMSLSQITSAMAKSNEKPDIEFLMQVAQIKHR